MVIAIDGPAGSGKSTTAREVARRLNLLYVDTGAMYRAVALACLRRSIDDPARLDEEVLRTIDIGARAGEDGAMHVLLDGEDVSGAIREPAVSALASRVAAVPAVRAKLVAEQRRIAEAHAREGAGVVLDGRDIGTVVFPDADLKVFLVADVDVRARRRRAELHERGRSVPLDEVRAELADRDRRDSQRAVGPLRKAADAVELDTSTIDIDEQVQAVIDLVQERTSESAV